MTNPDARFLAYGILIFCLLNALSIVEIWWSSSFEHYSWLIFLLWCMPLFFLFSSKEAREGHLFNPYFLGIAITSSIAGLMGDMRALEYIGLSWALYAFIPGYSWSHIFWLFGSAAWMPGISWFAAHLIPTYFKYFFILRALIAAIVGAWLTVYLIDRVNKRKAL
jgi:hypothetical protein